MSKFNRAVSTVLYKQASAYLGHIDEHAYSIHYFQVDYFRDALELVKQAGEELLRGQQESSIGNMVRRGRNLSFCSYLL